MAPSVRLEDEKGAQVQGRARFEVDIHLLPTLTLVSVGLLVLVLLLSAADVVFLVVLVLVPVVNVGTMGGRQAEEGSWFFPFNKSMTSLDIPEISTAEGAAAPTTPPGFVPLFEGTGAGTDVGANNIWATSPILFSVRVFQAASCKLCGCRYWCWCEVIDVSYRIVSYLILSSGFRNGY